MNIQAIMKQAQAMQKEMMSAKEEIDKMEFTGENSFVKVVVNGKKEVLKIMIDPGMELSKDDIEMLQDVLVVAINNAFQQVDKTTEAKMGKFANLPGMF